MKNNKGITLITLIVTIIIMIIIVGVTVSLTVDGGLLEQSKKAAFQTEVRQIQESLENKKTVVIAKNNGRTPLGFEISFDDLDMDTKIIDKHRDNLIIFNGDLYYDEDKTSKTEKEWLEEINVRLLHYTI